MVSSMEMIRKVEGYLKAADEVDKIELSTKQDSDATWSIRLGKKQIVISKIPDQETCDDLLKDFVLAIKGIRDKLNGMADAEYRKE